MSKVEEQGSEYKISSYPGYPISFSTLILKKLRGSIQSQELFFTLAVQSDLHLSQQQNESEKKVSLQVFTAILPWNLELTFTIYKKKAKKKKGLPLESYAPADTVSTNVWMFVFKSFLKLYFDTWWINNSYFSSEKNNWV